MDGLVLIGVTLGLALTECLWLLTSLPATPPAAWRDPLRAMKLALVTLDLSLVGWWCALFALAPQHALSQALRGWWALAGLAVVFALPLLHAQALTRARPIHGPGALFAALAFAGLSLLGWSAANF